MRSRLSPSNLFPKLIEEAENNAFEQEKPLRVLFQDEARFGRISDPRRCWCSAGKRPIVKSQVVREYTYLYGALSPADGHCDFLILPSMTKVCMAIFLEELSKRYPDDYLLVICDGAACHQMESMTLPTNVMMEILPPYCPDLNPCENLWDEIRETFFHNRFFKSMEAVEDQLIIAAKHYEANSECVRSIASWDWIINTD